MPTIDVDYVEFERMLGMQFARDLEKLGDILALVKGEVKLFNEKEGIMSVEIKDTNRPDLWNIEGMVRSLCSLLGRDRGIRQYTVRKSLTEVYVDARLRNIRPFIGCSIVKNVKLTDAIIRGLMHLQDKFDQTYGRNRRRSSIGLYDFTLIAPPLSYTVAKPTEVSFVPLGFEQKMNLKEILKNHPKGLEYGHIIDKHSVYPVLLDSEKKSLSFPPIINSNDLGRINENTRNVLVEVTGTVQETVLNTLRIVTLSLIDRGGTAYSVTIHYPHENLDIVTPSFGTSVMELDVQYANKILGLKLSTQRITELLTRAGFGVKTSLATRLWVQIPCYRIDIMHPVDLVEDIAIAYGYNNIKPLWRKLPTTGAERHEQPLLNAARELMLGLGFQEVLTYMLTNPEVLFTKMNCKKTRIVELANPKVQTFTCLRNWLLPGLIEFLSNNLHVECPQKIFELDRVTLLNTKGETRTRDEERLTAIIYDANANFAQIKSVLDSFLTNFGLEWEIKGTEHPSFIGGRAGTAIVRGTDVGVVGEIHPKVLEAWNLENPAAAFELNMEKLTRLKRARY